MIKKYQAIPIIIEAIQWDGAEDRDKDIVYFIGGMTMPLNNGDLIIVGEQGDITVKRGDFIVKDINRRISVYPEDIFMLTYQPIETI